jgi:transcriptional regulator with XRE-family HTH domain
MVDRIRQLLQARQLSPTQFADAIGVARPIMSHILGGRNKPSLEVVQKIIAAFPDVAMPWLLTGQGPMLNSEAPAAPPVATRQAPAAPETPAAPRRSPRTPQEPSVAVQAPESSEQLNTPPQPAPAPEPSPTPAVPVTPEPLVAAIPPPPVVVAAEPTAPSVPARGLLASPSKTIRRVLVFYSDGTFTDFSPASEGL